MPTFNPQPGDTIVCNNGETFIACNAVVQPTKPSAPNFSAPDVPKVAPAIVPTPVAPVQPKPAPSFSQGGYGSVKQAAPTYRSSPSPSFSRPSGSRR